MFDARGEGRWEWTSWRRLPTNTGGEYEPTERGLVKPVMLCLMETNVETLNCDQHIMWKDLKLYYSVKHSNSRDFAYGQNLNFLVKITQI